MSSAGNRAGQDDIDRQLARRNQLESQRAAMRQAASGGAPPVNPARATATDAANNHPPASNRNSNSNSNTNNIGEVGRGGAPTPIGSPHPEASLLAARRDSSGTGTPPSGGGALPSVHSLLGRINQALGNTTTARAPPASGPLARPLMAASSSSSTSPRNAAGGPGGTGSPGAARKLSVSVHKAGITDDTSVRSEFAASAAEAAVAMAAAASPPAAPAPVSDEEFARALQAEEDAGARSRAGYHDVTAAPYAASRSSAPAASYGQMPTATRTGQQGQRQHRNGNGFQDGEMMPVELEGYRQPAYTSGGAYSPSDGGGGCSDAEYAARLQQAELYAAAIHIGRPQEPEAPETPVMVDPVWGRFEGRPGKPYRPHEVLCLSMCPCLVPPYCTPSRKGAYRRVGRTMTLWVSLIQIALWAISLAWRGFAPMAVNPMAGPWPDTLDLLQAKNAAEVKYRYELWRLVTPIFLHAGIIHLATNLMMQLRMGLFLEIEWGTLQFTQIYFAAGIFGSVFSCLLLPTEIGVGASGALMGIMGAWIVHLLLHWSEGDEQAHSQRAFQFIMAVVNVFVIIGFSFVPFIDWAAHVFGLIGGMLIGCWVFSGSIKSPRKRIALQVASLLIYLGMFAGGLAALYQGVSPPVELLNFCQLVMLPAYPDQGLYCF